MKATASGAITSDGTLYTLSNNDLKLGFAKKNIDETIPANEAYLKVDDTDADFIAFYDAATGMDKINISVCKSKNTKIYNIAGQRTDSNHKGIFIKEGKKYVSSNK